MEKRLLEFDVAKAICIVLVVIGHYVPDDMPRWWRVIHDVIYSFHMPLFMFASGYVFIAFKKNETYSKFLEKKVKRLMLPYVVTSIIVITIKLLTQRGLYVENPVTWMSYIKMLYLPEAGYFLWFIWALWWMFCIVPFFKSKNARLALFGVAGIIHFFPMELTEILCLRQASSMLVYFMLGVVCFDWKKQVGVLKRIPALAIYLVFIGFEIAGNSFTDDIVSKFIGWILPFVGIGMVMALSSQIAKIGAPKALIIISSSSYLIYLFHTTFMGFAKAFVHKVSLMNGESDLWFSIGAFVVVTAGVVCPVLLHRQVLNRWKVTKVLFGLK